MMHGSTKLKFNFLMLSSFCGSMSYVVFGPYAIENDLGSFSTAYDPHTTYGKHKSYFKTDSLIICVTILL